MDDNTYALHMTITERRTKVTSIAINAYLIEKAKKLVDTGRFSSVSDVIITALTEFLYKTEVEQENINVKDLLLKLLNNSDCRRELENIMSTEPVKIVQNRPLENEEPDSKKVKSTKSKHIEVLKDNSLLIK